MKDAQGPTYEGKKIVLSPLQTVLLNPLKQRQIAQVSVCKCQALGIDQERVPGQRPRDGKLGLC